MTTLDFPARNAELKAGFGRLHDEAPAVTEGFFAMHRAATTAGALSSSTKELIALAIAIAVRCEGCLAFHVKDALSAGATREEIVEVIGVAVMMGGGPAMVYGTEALEAVNQFTAAKG